MCGTAPPPGKHPKLWAYRTGRAHPLSAKAGWVLVCDVDEFLVLHDADTIQDFIGDGERDFLGMAFNWRCFGTATSGPCSWTQTDAPSSATSR